MVGSLMSRGQIQSAHCSNTKLRHCVLQKLAKKECLEQKSMLLDIRRLDNVAGLVVGV